MYKWLFLLVLSFPSFSYAQSDQYVAELEAFSSVLGREYPVLELFNSAECDTCGDVEQFYKQLVGRNPGLVFMACSVSFERKASDDVSAEDVACSERQNKYVHSGAAGSIYTPQIIINGSASDLGAKYTSIYEAIDDLHHPIRLNVKSLADNKYEVILPAMEIVGDDVAVEVFFMVEKNGLPFIERVEEIARWSGNAKKLSFTYVPQLDHISLNVVLRDAAQQIVMAGKFDLKAVEAAGE